MSRLYQLINRLTLSVAVLATGFVLLSPAMALAAPSPTASPVAGGGGGGNGNGSASGSQNAICDGIGLAGGDCDANNTTNSVASLAATIINILSLLVGIIAVIMVIVGGLRYTLSAGDSNAASSAKNTIIFALVGLAIVALAQFIVHFVLDKLAGLS